MLSMTARDADHLALMREIGLRSAILLPIRVEDRTLGVLTLVNAESGRSFDEDDLRFADHIARRAAVAIDTAHRFRELSGG
jgi:GAF domain-containing protein